ncbi:MAG: SAF domain-containing protein [Actinomycetes bacterium]
MAELPSPTAARLPRARWLDTRLLLGLLLVLISVVLGAKLFAEADERVQVWAVTQDLGADTTLGEDDLQVRSVRLDETAGSYVSADEDVEGLVLDRPVGRGELLPLGSLRAPGSEGQRLVVIEVDRLAAAGLAKGRVVDVYAVRETRSGEPAADPVLVLAGVTVAEDANRGGSTFGGSGSKAGITLAVDEPDVTPLLDAVATGTVYVVQVPGGAGHAGDPADVADPRSGAS